MPHLIFPSHNIDGFYDEAMMKNKRGRVILYSKTLQEESSYYNTSSSGTALDSVNSWNSVKGSTMSEYFLPIGVTIMNDPLSMSTSIQWNDGGDFVDQVITNVYEGMHEMQGALAELLRTFKDGVRAAAARGSRTGYFNSLNKYLEGVASYDKLNEKLKQTRYKMVSAASTYSTFEGSQTDINIPTLNFTFPAEDFECTHLLKAWILLSFLLPNVGLTDEAKNSQKDEIRWMFEEAPNGYFNPKNGFDTSKVEGTFAMDIGGHIIKDLLPTSVLVQTSRKRVIASSDYQDEKGRFLKCYFDEDNNLFYSTDQSAKMKICQEEENVPLVIRVSCSFKFSRKITSNDYKDIMFKDIKDKMNLIKGKTYKSRLNLNSNNK